MRRGGYESKKIEPKRTFARRPRWTISGEAMLISSASNPYDMPISILPNRKISAELSAWSVSGGGTSVGLKCFDTRVLVSGNTKSLSICKPLYLRPDLGHTTSRCSKRPGPTEGFLYVAEMEPPETQPEPESEPGWLPEELWLSIFDQLDAITMAKYVLA